MQLLSILKGNRPSSQGGIVAGQHRPVIFQFGGGRQPAQPGQHVLHRGPVNAVVNVPRGVEAAGPQRPRPGSGTSRRAQVGQRGGH
jgi:hypothetical protein